MIVGLHSGLIPIVSRETGIDVDNFGIELPRSTIDEIRRAARSVSGRSADECGNSAEPHGSTHEIISTASDSPRRFAMSSWNGCSTHAATRDAGAAAACAPDSLDVADVDLGVRDENLPFDVGSAGNRAHHFENLQGMTDLGERLL